MNFEEMPLSAPLKRAVHEAGYELPTPIQEQAIPVLLEGRDLCGIAQTGTGKTAAFALPILQLLLDSGAFRAPKCARALALLPTRELAIQVADSFEAYSKFTALKTACVFGGVSDVPQKAALVRGVDVLVATPGRLLDLISQKAVSLKMLEFFVLDEADRMLDMGFIHDIRKVIAMLPPVRQNLFFSATMPPDIAKLAATILRKNPARIEVAPASTPIERISQLVYKVEKKRKGALLKTLLQDHPEMSKVLVFSRTKHGANRIVETLTKAEIPCAAIHGNKSQTRRQEALGNFKTEQIRVLVATDIAARGIDIDDVTHVFNYDLPEVPETYVHRIGRTARAGKGGSAISFCAPDEEAYLRSIEKLTRMKVPEGDRAVVEALPKVGEIRGRLAGQAPQRPERNTPRKLRHPGSQAAPAKLEPAASEGRQAPTGEVLRQPRRNRPGSRARKRLREAERRGR